LEVLQVIIGHSWTAVQNNEGGLGAAFTTGNVVISAEGLVSESEGSSSGVEGSRLRETDQRSGDERE